MLSRIAESLFWIGRYVERADNTARLLDVHLNVLLEDPWVDEPSANASLLNVMNCDFTQPVTRRDVLNHLAFEVPSMDDLFRIRDWLREHNVAIIFEGRKGPGGNPGVEFLDPDGYTIELYAGMEQIGWDGKSRPSKFWRRAKSLEEAVANPPPTHD